MIVTHWSAHGSIIEPAEDHRNAPPNPRRMAARGARGCVPPGVPSPAGHGFSAKAAATGCGSRPPIDRGLGRADEALGYTTVEIGRRNSIPTLIRRGEEVKRRLLDSISLWVYRQHTELLGHLQ